MNQCSICKHLLFFKPLPDDTFSCCGERGESVKDIDLKTGLSPAIEKYGTDEESCDLFGEGRSICETSEKEPFKLHPIREEGEKFLCKLLGLS